MENPFFFGKTVSGEAFVDRHKEMNEIEHALQRGQNVILFSPRRYGKTSLIKIVLNRLKRKGMLVFYIDLYRTATLQQFYQYFSQTVVQSLASPLNKLFGLIQSIVPSLRPKLVYTEPHSPSIEFEFSLESLRKEKTLHEFFDFVEKFCISRKKKACIVFDEFQEIRMMEESTLLEHEMRAAFQHHSHVSYAFLGSVNHLMDDIFKDKNKPFFNFGLHYELQAISGHEWIPYIGNKFSEAGFVVDSGSIERVIEITGGHPYYTQMVCSELWEAASQGAKVTIEESNKAAQEAVQKEKHTFQELWDSLALSERKFVLALSASQESQAAFSSEFLSNNQLGAASSVQRVVDRLLKRGVLLKNESRYLLSDPLLRLWLIRGEGNTG